MSGKRALVWVGILAVVAVLLIGRAFSYRPPPNVDPKMWRALSSDLGIELRIARGPDGNRQYYGLLMVKKEGHWRPVKLESPPGTLPAR
jgi:hypothetical protein